MSKEINVRGTKDYYTQRNNKIRPLSSCNVTSMIMALDYRSLLPSMPVNVQPEDDLYTFILNNSEVDAEYKKLFPGEYKKYIDSGKDYKKTYPPTELHALLSLGTNLWLGKKREEITKFRLDMTVKDILFEFTKGFPVVLSGKFGTMGHIVCGVGFTTSQTLVETPVGKEEIDVSKVDNIIIEDPYGDYRTKYSNTVGKDIKMPILDFMKIFNDSNMDRKWCHLFLV